MGRPKNEVVWNCFTKSGEKGVTCKFCKKQYMIGNVNKLSAHLLVCFKCPEDVRVQIRKYAEESNFNRSSQSAGSSSSAESDCSSRSNLSAVKPARKGFNSFFDSMPAQENVSPKYIVHLIVSIFSLLLCFIYYYMCRKN